ncbi:hypothetical protein ACVINW_002171 [Bradyrhizobium sp. USDA 4461]
MKVPSSQRKQMNGRRLQVWSSVPFCELNLNRTVEPSCPPDEITPIH